MNILQINSVCGIGSTGRIVTDLHTILTDRGHQSSIAYGRDSAHNCKQAIRIGSKLDNVLHVGRTRLFDSHGFGSATATQKLITQIKILDPDVIHLHNIHGYYLHIRLLFEYLKEVNKPVIWTLHDCWSFTGHCSYFDFVGCDRWQSKCYNCPLKGDYPKSIGLDRSRLNFKQKKALFTGLEKLTLVTPSYWLAGLVKQSFLKKYPVEVIHNGIDLEAFQPTPSCFRQRYNLENKFILLGVAAVWTERKGYDYFLELATRLKPDETLVLVGVNEKQIKSFPDNIIGIGRTSSTTELAEIYSAADVFVNPTLEEVLGLVNIEALSCGTPVITFSSGGSPECLDEGCGLVVERGDLSALVAAIATIKNNGRESYSARGQKRAQNHFDKDDRFEEYIALYEKYLN